MEKTFKIKNKLHRKMFLKNKIVATIFLILLIFQSANYFFIETASAQSTMDKAEKELRAQLAQLEEEARILEQSLNEQKGKTATISRDVNILADEIKQAQIKIQQKNLEIQELSGNISIKQQTILELEEKRERAKKDLSFLIKRTNQTDTTSVAEIFLSNRTLADFFLEVDQYKLAQRQLEALFQEIRDVQNMTEEEKASLELIQNRERDAKAVIERERNTVSIKKSEQDNLLAASKRSEATYQSILEERKAQAASIRAALFRLRDTDGIAFGDAIRYAESASKQTGVRAAFILAVLKQESNIGQHLGSCVIYDLQSGKSQGVNTGRIFNQGIHPTRDLPTLQEVLAGLGRDPLETRISCPLITELAGGAYKESGYGGAMGPSQFIPSTWKMYMAQLRQIFGVHPDPWNPEHAIMATALLLRDNGAAGGGYTAERTAALKYYAGGNWNLLQNAFYGNGVMQHADDMQRQIDFLADVARD